MPPPNVVVAFRKTGCQKNALSYSLGTICKTDERRQCYHVLILPSGPIAWYPAECVEKLEGAILKNLSEAPQYNGEEVLVCKYNEERGRIVVELLQSGRNLLVTADKLDFDVETMDAYWDMKDGLSC